MIVHPPYRIYRRTEKRGGGPDVLATRQEYHTILGAMEAASRLARDSGAWSTYFRITGLPKPDHVPITLATYWSISSNRARNAGHLVDTLAALLCRATGALPEAEVAEWLRAHLGAAPQTASTPNGDKS